MNRTRRSSLAAGVLLILLGAWFLAMQLVPGMGTLFSWPWIIIAVGAVLLLIGLASGAPAMAIPACIVGGIGGLLYWQNVTGNWESWAYAWTLIPGFVGLGIILAGLLGDDHGEIQGGAWLVAISLVLFLAFGSFFGALGLIGPYWPVLLILLGLMMLLRPFSRLRSSGPREQAEGTEQLEETTSPQAEDVEPKVETGSPPSET